MKINAIVILYNSSIDKSLTIRSILNADTSNIDLKITLWNNGKKLLDEDDVYKYIPLFLKKGISIEIYQDIRNVSLSKIYNHFIRKLDFDYFSILDQDSTINKDFFQNIRQNDQYHIICPEIYLTDFNNEKNSPLYNTDSELLHPVPEGDFNAAKVLACGSGLSLSNDISQKMLETYSSVFDEDYAFYWADHSLFKRLGKFQDVRGKCIGKMFHSISGFGKKYRDMPESSKLEHGYGKLLLRMKENGKKGKIRNFIYSIKYIEKSRCNFTSALKILKCALTEKHPRTSFEINSNITPTHDKQAKI